MRRMYNENEIKEIAGGGYGNIDLYRHCVNFQDKLYFTQVSSKDIFIESLTDLQAVFPDDVWMSASGVTPDNSKQVIAINCARMRVRYTDSTEDSLEAYEAPTDFITTI